MILRIGTAGYVRGRGGISMGFIEEVFSVWNLRLRRDYRSCVVGKFMVSRLDESSLFKPGQICTWNAVIVK